MNVIAVAGRGCNQRMNTGGIDEHLMNALISLLGDDEFWKIGRFAFLVCFLSLSLLITMFLYYVTLLFLKSDYLQTDS